MIKIFKLMKIEILDASKKKKLDFLRFENVKVYFHQNALKADASCVRRNIAPAE